MVQHYHPGNGHSRPEGTVALGDKRVGRIGYGAMQLPLGASVASPAAPAAKHDVRSIAADLGATPTQVAWPGCWGTTTAPR